MTREGERELVKVEHVNGGDGYIVREAMVTSEEVGEACKMYAKIHLDPGCEVGYHYHHGETESYFILTGHGTYDDNGEKQPVPDGEYTLENDMIVVIVDSKCVEIKEQSNNSNSSDGVQMSKEQNEDFLISLADNTDLPLTPEQISKAIRILIDYNFGWKIKEKKENEFFNEIISMAKEELKKDVDDVKLSIATQIAEGFTKLSEAVKEEEKEVEEIKLTKKQDAENERKSILDLIKEK